MEFKFITKPNLLLLIVSGVLFITTFLPWWTVDYGVVFGTNLGSYSVNGFHNGGVLTFLMSLVGIAAAFLESQKTRALIAMGAGILAVLGAVIALASLGGASMGFGLIIALIASVALGLVGYMEYRKWKGLSTPSVFNKSTPPAQSTPSAQTAPPASPTTPSTPPPPPPAPPRK
jgi:hypothetical protein